MLERIIELIAPHLCYSCGSEGSVLCAYCRHEYITSLPGRCYRCMRLSGDAKVCADCRHQVALRHVWVRTEYSGLAKDLIHGLKFERVRAASRPIAELMEEALPYGVSIDMVIPVPTATTRVRQRGYDQAALLARHIAAARGLSYDSALRRLGKQRQVGADRTVRLRQLQKAFYCPHPESIKGKAVLLVDDVVTTGASLEYAALVLRRAGATSVHALVFAQKQ